VGTVVVVMFLVLLSGGIVLALVMGILATEEGRARKERHPRAGATASRLAEIPRFFADLDDTPVAGRGAGPHDEIVGRLEDYLRAEQALVAGFVREPSIENLYRRASPSAP
jgi:hypothetical protein